MRLVAVGLKQVLISAYSAMYISPWEGRLFDINRWKKYLLLFKLSVKSYYKMFERVDYMFTENCY